MPFSFQATNGATVFAVAPLWGQVPGSDLGSDFDTWTRRRAPHWTRRRAPQLPRVGRVRQPVRPWKQGRGCNRGCIELACAV